MDLGGEVEEALGSKNEGLGGAKTTLGEETTDLGGKDVRRWEGGGTLEQGRRTWG